jgi:hypothetical protein
MACNDGREAVGVPRYPPPDCGELAVEEKGERWIREPDVDAVVDVLPGEPGAIDCIGSCVVTGR